MTEEDTFKALRKPDLHHMERLSDECWQTLVIDDDLNHCDADVYRRRDIAKVKYWSFLEEHGWSKEEFLLRYSK